MELIRLLRAECQKMRRTILPAIHLCVPVAVSLLFLAYYRFAPWSSIGKISGYVQVLGIALPFLISIICAISVELEAGNHFQVMLGVVRGRKRVLAAKWLTLLGMELFALALAVGIFGLGYGFLERAKIPPELWLILTGVLWFGSVLLYLWHLFLNLQFSKMVSLGVGMGESLISALFLTGLGEGRWQYVPGSYSARGSSEVFLLIAMERTESYLVDELVKNLGICLLITAACCAIIFLWFQFYEGRMCDD